MIKKIPIANTHDTITPSKIICVGRNYRKHIEEMKSIALEKPMFFLKPPSALILPGENIVLPSQSSDVHHEVELAVVIKKQGKNIIPQNSSEYILGYAIFLDLTARDLQAEAKKKGLAWSEAKGFDTFAPISEITRVEGVVDPQHLDIQLWVNEELRQSSNTSYMLFSVAELIADASSIFTLEAGDIIATGTPEGVAAIYSGDVIRAAIDQLGSVSFMVH